MDAYCVITYNMYTLSIAADLMIGVVDNRLRGVYPGKHSSN